MTFSFLYSNTIYIYSIVLSCWSQFQTLFFLFCFGHAQGMWKSLGQRLNQSQSSDKAKPLTAGPPGNSSNFKYPALLLYSSHSDCFWCFSPNCFVYPLATYCEHRWFYYFCLLTSLNYIYQRLLSFTVCLPLLVSFFHYVIFFFLVLAFSFPPRETPITFVLKLFWWFWILICRTSDFSIKSEWVPYR